MKICEILMLSTHLQEEKQGQMPMCELERGE